MVKLLAEIQTLALRLRRDEREKLASVLLDSLEDAPASEVDEAWVAEAERRYEDRAAGKTGPIREEHFITDMGRELECE